MKESITYDAMGQRISKTVTNKNVTMFFFYDVNE